MKKRKRPKTATTHRPASHRVLLPLVFLFLFTFPTSHSLLHGRERPRFNDYALIFGTVWGPDDRPIAGINVSIRGAHEKKVRWVVRSNRRGEFEQRVPVGPADYVVRADTKSYKLPAGKHFQESPEVTVHVDHNERADTGLHLK